MNSKNNSNYSENVLNFWEDAKIFEKSVVRDAKNGDYVFYDGPPFATGTPHYGHIVASIIKDVVPRYWTMKGYKVERKWGWDCHGLPIENIVEKEIGSKRKKDIEKIGVEKFIEMCRSKLLGYVDEWEKTVKKLGRWVDMKNSYRTMDLEYMESVWWVFKELWDKGLIYKDYRSMHVCPRCETTLSQSEVAEGYKDVKDLSATVKFELIDEPGTFVLAWTTTPWTLIGNVALAVGEDIDYAVLEVGGIGFETSVVKVGDKLILASDNNTFMRVFGNLPEYDEVNATKGKVNFNGKGEIEFSNIQKVKGKDLVGKSYKPLFDYYASNKEVENVNNGWKVCVGVFVNTEEGTGVVHIAPAFGEDDMTLGRENKLPFVQHVGLDGYIKEEAGDFAGLNVKPIDDSSSTDVEIIKYLAHNGLLFSKEKYEHSYPHCWRCETPLINYATSSWFVGVTKIKQDLLKNAKEVGWTPEHIKEGRFGNWLESARDWSISRQRYWASVMPVWECECGELKVVGSVKELEDLSGEKITDIHKHVVDKITFKCEKCGQAMKRIPDVLDTWFDSGSMPYAQMHYPFENKEKLESNLPAQFIAEGVDQTRCWFYYLHVIAGGIKNKPAFKNVIVNGIVLAEDGKKMSKRLQNYPDPNFVIDKYGADALRHYLCSSHVMQADDLCFSEASVNEALRKNIMLLNNVHSFFEMFASGMKESNAVSDHVLDLWVLAKLKFLVKEVSWAMNDYNLPKAARPITAFIDELSTWYLRRSRERFKGADQADKEKALNTLHFTLLTLSKVIAPFMPFIAEDLWQKLSGNNFENNDRSVHLEEWPVFEQAEDAEVFENMALVKKIVELGLAKRDEAGIKVRQPLNKLTVNNIEKELEGAYLDLIMDEVNLKNIELKKGGGDLNVELDTEITEDLKLEGVKRDLVRTINNMRKNSGLTIGDRVSIAWQTDSELIKKTIDLYCNDIKEDVLADDLREDEVLSEEVKVSGEAVRLSLKKE